MASKILTEQEVYNIGLQGTPTANLLCTYARAQALGCTVASGYTLESNQLVYQDSLRMNRCVYSITSGPYEEQADCEGYTSTSFRYNVSGYVNASNQWGEVSGDVGGWSSNGRWDGTEEAEYTHPGCPNSITIIWDVYQEDCGPQECTYTITEPPYEDQAACIGNTSTSFRYNVSGYVNETNQHGTVSGDVGRWNQNRRWTGTKSVEYTHPGCPNSTTITWDVYQEDCGPQECTYTITSGPETDYNSNYDNTSTSFIYNVSGYVNATNQSGSVSGKVDEWEKSKCIWRGSGSAEYTHSGCPNSTTITWDVRRTIPC